MNRLTKLLLTLLTLLVLSACGGSGDSYTAATDPNTEFQSFPTGYFAAGYTDTINYTGSDTHGSTYTATISLQTQTQSTFLGQPAIPVLEQIQLTNISTGESASATGTGYFSTDPNDRRILGYSDSETETVAAVTSVIPQTAKIGDFGDIGTYTDNAGNVTIESWRLDPDFSGRAKLVLLSTEKDQFGSLVATVTKTNLIDTSSNIITSEIVIFYADLNVTVTLNGS